MIHTDKNKFRRKASMLHINLINWKNVASWDIYNEKNVTVITLKDRSSKFYRKIKIPPEYKEEIQKLLMQIIPKTERT